MGTLLTRNYKYRTAKQFLELFSSNSHRIYAVIGNDATGQSAVLNPAISLSSDISHWDSLKGIKKVTSSDVSLVIPHGTGASLKKIENGVSFTPYNHTLDLFGTQTEFLGYTDDNTRVRVWKCLFNGSGATVSDAPDPADDSNTGVFIQSDGYHWKYLYSFASTSVFNTDDTNFKWMPVESLQIRPSNADLLKQWNVQAAAVDGAVNSIVHSSNFTGYTNGDAVTLTSSDGGSGFTGEIAIANSKQHVSITTAGTGYRNVTAVNVAGSVDSNLTAMISPISGHGFDAEREVGAKDLMITCQITNSDIPVASALRYATVALILDPIISGSSQDDITTSGTSIASGTRASDTTYLQAELLKYSGQILYIDQRATVTRDADNTDTIRLVIQS